MPLSEQHALATMWQYRSLKRQLIKEALLLVYALCCSLYWDTRHPSAQLTRDAIDIRAQVTDFAKSRQKPKAALIYGVVCPDDLVRAHQLRAQEAVEQ